MVVLGLVLAAAYVAGHYLAVRYAVEQVSVEIRLQRMDVTADDKWLAAERISTVEDTAYLLEEAADVREEGHVRGYLVALAAVCLMCIGILLPRLKGRARTVLVVVAGVVWGLYPVSAVLTFAQWVFLHMGDGGATGFNEEYADWLPRMLLVLVVAAALQAIGLVMQARRRPVEPTP
ncbi:hypothetical protein E1295_20080 [Nonomuraea mesophila]|uniref:Uncharacterized protein n=1 Tax=Nonomuraea mesophila TaxID=2530382 RepID=A0A4R5FH18_9ACTN|nr:hypothetical protein [Nonomuraea mesophila]TDE49946.1 hypothetical protein E1295_20080 [Nonomuraea mesophila]